jgi:hypothetical protein
VRELEIGKAESQVIAVKDIKIDRAWSVEAVVMGATKIVLDALKL